MDSRSIKSKAFLKTFLGFVRHCLIYILILSAVLGCVVAVAFADWLLGLFSFLGIIVVYHLIILILLIWAWKA